MSAIGPSMRRPIHLEDFYSGTDEPGTMWCLATREDSCPAVIPREASQDLDLTAPISKASKPPSRNLTHEAPSGTAYRA